MNMALNCDRVSDMPCDVMLCDERRYEKEREREEERERGRGRKRERKKRKRKRKRKRESDRCELHTRVTGVVDG